MSTSARTTKMMNYACEERSRGSSEEVHSDTDVQIFVILRYRFKGTSMSTPVGTRKTELCLRRAKAGETQNSWS